MTRSHREPSPHRPTRLAGLSIALLLCSLPATVARAQSAIGMEKYETSYLEPPTDAARGAAAPKMIFSLTAEIPLPGPLPEYGPRLVEERVRIPVAGGLAESGWAADSEVRVSPVEGIEKDPRDARSLLWALAPNGKARYALTEDGILLAQKRCKSCAVGWRQRWRLRVAGVGLAPPLVTDKRIFYGALDNRVYGLKRRNGHRVWAADLDGRVSRSLRLWQPPAGEAGPDGEAEETPPSLILVVPDDGSGIVALDARSGAKVASYDLPDDGGELIGVPVVTPDGGIVVARQKYTPTDASLMVFNLVRPRRPA